MYVRVHTYLHAILQCSLILEKFEVLVYNRFSYYYKCIFISS